jgi:hypothetical protein
MNRNEKCSVDDKNQFSIPLNILDAKHRLD